MVNKEVKHFVLERLKELPVCIPNSTRTQWTIRCPFCGDSKNQAHGHLSIKIDEDDDTSPMLYRCFKCDASGLVTDQFLQDLGIYLDNDSIKELRSINRRSIRKNRFTNDRIENYIVPIPSDNNENKRKLQYINDRLGLDLEFEDCPRLKIVLDFYQFLNVNHIGIDDLGMPEWSRRNLAYHYVGFLSQSNNVLTCRCIESDPKFRRYIKVILNLRNQNPASFYMIPVSVSLISNKPLVVHIAEGTFDIISIHENFGIRDDRNIYAAVCGYGPGTILKYLIYNGLMYKTIVHIYCDNDKSDEEEITVLRKHPEVIPWIDKLYFHRNGYDDEKDYGVPVDRINDQSYIMGQGGYLRK